MGNICRSPAAEIIFRHLVEKTGLEAEYFIDSAGTIGYHEGSPPDPRMSETLRRRGYKISGRARQIQRKDLDEFDLIVTMDEANLDNVRDLDPSGNLHNKVRPLVGFCKRHHEPRVPDPYYGGQKGFELVIDLLEDGCAAILEEMSARD